MPIRSVLCLLGVLLAIEVRPQSVDEKELVARIEQLRLAMVNADGQVLRELTADDLSYGHSGGGVEGKDAFIEKITSGRSDFVAIDLTEQSIKITGDVAIVRHKLSGQTNDNGKPGTVNLSVLLIWQKQKRQWKLIARQSVKIQ